MKRRTNHATLFGLCVNLLEKVDRTIRVVTAVGGAKVGLVTVTGGAVRTSGLVRGDRKGRLLLEGDPARGEIDDCVKVLKYHCTQDDVRS